MKKSPLQFAPLLLIFFFMIFNPFKAGAADAPHHWNEYVNSRFQYTICYPSDLLTPQGEADNGDGQKFLAKNGAQLIVYGSYNALNQKLQDVLTENENDLTRSAGKITYKALKKDWFVLSGERGTSIFYMKTMYDKNPDQFTSFELDYPSSASAAYQPLIQHIASCFGRTAGIASQKSE